MTGQRTFDQHVGLFVAYGTRVAGLKPASWERLRLRCAELNGPGFRALVDRALLAARPYELWLPMPAHRSGLRAIASVSRVVQTGLAFAFEIAAEFGDSDSMPVGSTHPRTQSSGKPRTEAYVHATALIESATAPLRRTDPGVVTAVRAAGQAVLRHDWLPPADFEAVYRFIESEIPFAGLEASTAKERGDE